MQIGGIYVEGDPAKCVSHLYNDFLRRDKIIVMDYNELLPIGGPIIGGTILIPPASIFNYFMDGMFDYFAKVYTDYLLGVDSMTGAPAPNPASEFLDTLAASIYGGRNIYIYADLAGYEDFPYIDYIANAFHTKYGITIAFPGRSGFSIENPLEIIEAAYRKHVIDRYEFLKVHPVDAKIDIETLNMLMDEFQPFIYGPVTIESVYNYFNEFKKQLREAKYQELQEVITIKGYGGQ